MHCGFKQELLSMYADGALSRPGILQVEIHLGKCEECQRAIEDIRFIGNALHSIPREPPPHEMIARILANAEARVNQSAWNAVMWSVAAVWSVALGGFEISDERAALLRSEAPDWVARWVLFV